VAKKGLVIGGVVDHAEAVVILGHFKKPPSPGWGSPSREPSWVLGLVALDGEG
jgi:hypothetical protein